MIAEVFGVAAAMVLVLIIFHAVIDDDQPDTINADQFAVMANDYSNSKVFIDSKGIIQTNPDVLIDYYLHLREHDDDFIQRQRAERHHVGLAQHTGTTEEW